MINDFLGQLCHGCYYQSLYAQPCAIRLARSYWLCVFLYVLAMAIITRICTRPKPSGGATHDPWIDITTEMRDSVHRGGPPPSCVLVVKLFNHHRPTIHDERHTSGNYSKDFHGFPKHLSNNIWAKEDQLKDAMRSIKVGWLLVKMRIVMQYRLVQR